MSAKLLAEIGLMKRAPKAWSATPTFAPPSLGKQSPRFKR